jgi:hypothetical protein
MHSMALPTQDFPEVSHLLEVRAPDKSIRYWLDGKNRVALQPSSIIDLFRPALPHGVVPANDNGHLSLDVLGYDRERKIAVILGANSCFVCAVDPDQGVLTSRPVPVAVVTGYIGSRKFLNSIRRSVDLVDTVLKWVERRS